VWGVAVQVDGQYVYSDSQGQFFLRFSRAGAAPVQAVTGLLARRGGSFQNLHQDVQRSGVGAGREVQTAVVDA
jgi:hypothetical protein